MPSPVVASSGQPASTTGKPEESPKVGDDATGYLQFVVSSNISPLTRGTDYEIDGAVTHLLASADIQIGGQSLGAIPIALYDIDRRALSNKAGVNLTKNQYVGLSEVLNRPTVTLTVSAVPKAAAKEIIGAVNAFVESAQNIPIPALTGSPALKIAGSVLKAVSHAAIPSDKSDEWTASTEFGWDGGNQMPLPLDGRAALVFLVPSKGNAHNRVPASTDVQVCADDDTQICLAGDTARYKGLPYLIVRATLRPYRPLSDFGQNYVFDCDRSESDYGEIAKTVASGQFTRSQRTTDDALLNRLRVVLDIKAGTWVGDPNVAANLVERYLYSKRPSDDVWKRYGGPADTLLQSCIDNLVVQQGIKASQIVWPLWRAAVDTASKWPAYVQLAAAATDSVARLRHVLHVIDLPIKTFALKDGDAFVVLDYQRGRISSELLKFTKAAIPTIDTLSSIADLESARAQLMSRAEADVDCLDCVAALSRAAGEMAAKGARLQAAAAAEATRVAAAKAAEAKASAEIDLAAAKAEATEAVSVAKDAGVPGDKSTLAVAAAVRGAAGASITDIRARTDSVNKVTANVRQAVRDSVSQRPPNTP